MLFYVYFCITKPVNFDPLAFCEGEVGSSINGMVVEPPLIVVNCRPKMQHG